MSNWVIVIFVALWVVTFIPAWQLLLKLLALSVSDKPIGSSFVFLFLLYRFIIALPYLVLIILGTSLPNFLVNLVIGILVLGFILSVFRFFARKRSLSLLWAFYSYVYDGLLSFYPYTHLLELVSRRVNAGNPANILDAGCGTGNLALKISKSNNSSKVTAIDSSRPMVKIAAKKLQNRSNTTVHRSEIVDFFRTHPTEKFDTIVMVNVLYAVGDRRKLWSECLGHLKSGGRIVVTNSDKGGSWPIIKEHLQNASFFKLFHPKLLGVFIVDYFISQLAAAGKFNFLGIEELKTEVDRAGGRVSDVERCYGGAKNGVNLLFTVTARR